MSKDRLFLRFVTAMTILMFIFAIATIIVAFIGDGAIASKMINVFAGMFSGVLGLGSGYLLGRQKNGD